MKKLRLKKWVKYLLLGIINLIIILNINVIIKEPITINQYRINILILAAILLSNGIAILKIEN